MSRFICLLLIYAVITLFNCSLLASEEREDHLESLKALVESEEHDTVRINAMIELSTEIRSKDPDAALQYAKNALELAQKLDLEVLQGHALNRIGIVHWQKGELGLAMDHLLEARHIFMIKNYKPGIARIMTNIGLIYSDRSHYEKALEYFFEALRLFEEEDNQIGMAVIFNNIGRIYQNTGDFDLSERYHNLSLNIKTEFEEKRGMSFSYNNLGIVYKHQGKYDEAVEYFRKALQIRKKLGDKREVASTKGHLGLLYLKTDNYDLALNELYEALQLYEEVDDKSGISRNLNFLGQAYMGKNNLPKAEQCFNESLGLAEDVGLARVITENYNNLAELYSKQNNFQKAYNYQQKYLSLTDSIYTEESRRRIYEFQMIFDSERKEREIELYRKASQINALNFEKQRLLKNFLLAGIVLVVLLLFLLYNRFLVINKTNKLLEKRKDEVSKSNAKLVKLNQILLEQKKKLDDLNKRLNTANQKLIDSEKHLIEANVAKDKLFSIISHDLRNPFASIVSFSRMLKRDLDNLDKDELRELTLELDKTVVNINDLLENLLQWSRTQIGKIKYNPQYIDITEIVNDNVNLFMPNAQEKQISIENHINSNLIAWADQNMTDTVMRNLLSNAIKFTNQKGKIKLFYETDNNHAYISVKDSGVGINKQDQEMLFRADSLHSTYGTFDEKGSGIGLLLCKEFVERQHGEIKFESEEGEGSVFTFSLPLSEFF